MSGDNNVCLGARLLDGFIGFDISPNTYKLAENFYSIPTSGEMELSSGKVSSVTNLTKLARPEVSFGIGFVAPKSDLQKVAIMITGAVIGKFF